jgi:hypothetical protein
MGYSPHIRNHTVSETTVKSAAIAVWAISVAKIGSKLSLTTNCAKLSGWYNPKLAIARHPSELAIS